MLKIMRMDCIYFILGIGMFLHSCKSKEKPESILPTDGIQCILDVGSSKWIEKNGEKLNITIQNIHRNETDISITGNDNLIAEKSISEKESIEFSFNNLQYELKLIEIKKSLLGASSAEIYIQTLSNLMPNIPASTVENSIEQLIEKATQQEVTFFRNNDKISARKFFRRLNKKYHKQDNIKTVEQFITQIDADEKYKVATATDTVSLAQWLTQLSKK